jgi:energy-coupling factor transport system permease protein
LSPRFAFVALATLEAVPAMVERAGVIQAAQRARGLDTEGSIRARLRGVLPLVGPVVLSSLTEVEERSLALEVRAFGRPGRRHLLWSIPDSVAQLAVRAGLLVTLIALIVLRMSGNLVGLP